MSNPNNANTVPDINYISNNANLALSQGQTNYLAQDAFIDQLSPNKFLQFPNSPTITLGPRSVTYAANTLGSTKKIYTSPLLSDIELLAEYYSDWGFSYQITENQVYTISVDVAWDELTGVDFSLSEYSSEQWEITPVAGSKSLIYSGLLTSSFVTPTMTGNYQVLPLALQAAVQRANQSGGYYLNITGSLDSASLAQYAPYIPTANRVLQYLKLGIDGISQYTQTIKRTACIDVHNRAGAFKTAADLIQNELNNQGTINYILSGPNANSLGGMIKNYAIPPNTVGQFMLPSYSKVLGVPNIDPIIYTVYAGYLVQPPTISFIGLNKVQITQLFVWDEWADGMYYIASPKTDFPLVYSAS